MDSIHLREINKGRIQAITTFPVAIFDFSILRSQVLDLVLHCVPPRLFTTNIRQITSDCFIYRVVFADRFQLKLNRLITPYVKESLKAPEAEQTDHSIREGEPEGT